MKNFYKIFNSNLILDATIVCAWLFFLVPGVQVRKSFFVLSIISLFVSNISRKLEIDELKEILYRAVK